MGETTAVGGRLKTGTARRARGPYRSGTARYGLLMAAPLVLLVAVFTLYPFGRAIYESTRVTSPFFDPEFVGLANYRDVITSDYFVDAALTTLLLAVVVVPLMVVLGVLVALLLNEPFFGNTALRAGMLLPWAIPASVAGLIWKWIFLDSWGALNALLFSVGIIDSYQQWLTTPNLARMAVVIVFVWAQLPLTAILILAAVQAVPRELYDAAAIDGAGWWRVFRGITLPLLAPWLLLNTLRDIMLSAQGTFAPAYIMTGGDPYYATLFLPLHIYNVAFGSLRFGQATAMMLLLLLGVGLVLLLVYHLLGGWGYDDDL